MPETALPFMLVYSFPYQAGWFQFECELCGYACAPGTFPHAESHAAEHLAEQHPRRHVTAAEREREARLAALTAGPRKPASHWTRRRRRPLRWHG